MRHLALILGTTLLIAACGTKGPLTKLPKPVTAPATAAAPAETPAADASTKAGGVQ